MGKSPLPDGMDPLTHTVFGVACAMAGTRQKGSRRAAALAGLAGGLLPDADILIRSATDPLFAIEYHRHFTHSLAFLPVIAVIGAQVAAWLLRLFKRPVSMTTLLLPALLGGLSHLFCDAWTSYGTRLWWPFASTRVSLNWISVIDPVFTIPLVACIALALRYASRRAAAVGLTWAALYLGFCIGQQRRASSALDRWLATSPLPNVSRVEVKPSFGNVILWRALVEAGGECHVLAIRCPLGGPPTLQPGPSQPILTSPELAAAAMGIPPDSTQARDIRRFYHFSDSWVGRHPSDPMVLGDLRYANLPAEINPLWGIRLDPGSPQEHVQWRTFRGDPTPSLLRLARLVEGSESKPTAAPPLIIP